MLKMGERGMMTFVNETAPGRARSSSRLDSFAGSVSSTRVGCGAMRLWRLCGAQAMSGDGGSPR